MASFFFFSLSYSNKQERKKKRVDSSESHSTSPHLFFSSFPYLASLLSFVYVHTPLSFFFFLQFTKSASRLKYVGLTIRWITHFSTTQNTQKKKKKKRKKEERAARIHAV